MRLNVEIDDETYARFREIAARRKWSVSVMIRSYVEDVIREASKEIAQEDSLRPAQPTNATGE